MLLLVLFNVLIEQETLIEIRHKKLLASLDYKLPDVAKQPLVSVILPVYRVEKFLQQTVMSLLAQTYKNIEIILVDDESPDECPQICDALAKIDSRVRVIHQKNCGCMGAWIAGYKISQGQYITFLDPDDNIIPDAIAKEMACMLTEKADLVITGFNMVYANSVLPKAGCCEGYLGVLDGEKLADFKTKAVQEINYYVPLYRWNKLFRRELIENNLQYCNPLINLGEDICISLGAILDAKRIVVLPDHCCNYIQRNSSIIRSYNGQLFNQCQILITEIIKMLRDKNYYFCQGEMFENARILFVNTKNFITSNLDNQAKKTQYQKLLTSEIAQVVKNYSGRKYFSRNYRLFLKLFYSGSFVLVKLFFDAYTSWKNLLHRTIKD